MTTRFLLVRHGTCAPTASVLLGRVLDVPLAPDGEVEARAVAERLRAERPVLVEASPRLRAQQTAQAIAAAVGVPVTTSPDLDELDFGHWSGRTFADLEADPAWRTWNARRSAASTPAGDRIASVQARITRHLRRLARAFPCATLVLVTHAEVIRAALLQTLARPADDWASLQIPTASVSALRLRGPRFAVESIGARACA